MPFSCPIRSLPFVSYCFPFLFFHSIGCYYGAGVFGLMGCYSLSPSRALPIFFNIAITITNISTFLFILAVFCTLYKCHVGALLPFEIGEINTSLYYLEFRLYLYSFRNNSFAQSKNLINFSWQSINFFSPCDTPQIIFIRMHYNSKQGTSKIIKFYCIEQQLSSKHWGEKFCRGSILLKHCASLNEC